MEWLVAFRDAATAWLPLLFAILLVLMLYVLWRTLQVMPRVTPAKTVTATSLVTWNDVAGLEEAKEELREGADFLRTRSASGRAARGSRKEFCSTARREPARPCSPRRSRTQR